MHSFSTGLTAEDLRDLARRAVSDFVANGTGLSQAVVKCASASGVPLTAEHVRRVCEMTYHEAYDRLYKSSPGPDRWVSFDPPDPVFCAEALRAQKVASAPVKETRMTAQPAETQKTASAPARQKFVPRNAWDAAMDRVPTKLASEERWANPQGEVLQARQRLKSAVEELEAQEYSIDLAEKVAMLKLQAQAEQVIRNEGLDAGTVLQACVRDDTDGVPVKVASDVLCALSRYLGTRGHHMPDKVASVALRVNPSHPLPRAYQEVADLRTEKLAVAEALGEMRDELARLSRGMRAISN